MASQQVAAQAAKLWANTIRDGFSYKAGDTRIDAAFSRLSLQSITEVGEISNAEIEAFENLLAAKVSERLINKEEVFLTTDYSPEGFLKEVVQGYRKLNIPTRFPIKSRMWVYRDRIVYSFGYGQDLQEWYPL